MKQPHVGFGPKNFDLAIYIANRPPIDHYPQLDQLQVLAPGEVAAITARTSNHWRKAFNVCAKFIVELRGEQYSQPSWQAFRDRQLFQADCREALLFSPPNLQSPGIHIIAGKTYASDLSLDVPLTWLDNYFAVNRQFRLVVSPYLDYRQLSNARIIQLVTLVKSLAKT
ncbi:DUF6942 family protein [Teredinibacter haidensis]|uniref:DUF6942 family protein n=1 Tax=Teredinibacter haidensis TaxID=2731755 RepID=UPI000948EB9F|nr:hypothetical protein [Teredinibacter haidensis]